MRPNGRPFIRRPAAYTPLGAASAQSLLRVEGPYIFKGSIWRCGVLLSVTIAWTGQLVRMARYTFDEWFALSRDARRMSVDKFFKKPGVSPSPVGVDGAGGLDSVLEGRCPALAFYLGSDIWPGGEVREHASLIIFYEDGQYKGCLSDRSTNMTLWATARALEDIPEALEARLTEPSPDWRKQRQKGKRA